MTPLSTMPWWMQLVVVTLIVGVSVAAWWYLVRMVWASLKDYLSIDERWQTIKKDPISLAIVMSAVYLSAAYLVASGFSRFIG